MSKGEPVWTRLYLARIDIDRTLDFLLSLASDRRSPTLAVELRADINGISYLIGCEATVVQRIKRLIRDHLPDTLFDAAPARAAVREVGQLQLRPSAFPLRTDNPVAVTRALLSAMAAPLREGEVQVVQILLGRRRPMTSVAPDASSPPTSWWQPLTRGRKLASSDERARLKVRAEDAGFDAVVRVGVVGSDSERTRRLSVAIHSAIATAKGPAVHLSFVHVDARHLNEVVVPRRFGLELSSGELLGLLGWPLGDDDLPGVPSLHPKPVRPSSSVHRGERVFAVPGVPGDSRPVGISSSDALFHMASFGPSGSGKSTAMLHLVEADMNAGGPVAVFDPKRQLIDDISARIPVKRRDDVVIVEVGTTGYNPLELAGRDPDVIVDGLMSVFAGVFANGFGPRTLDIFSGTLRSLARASVVTGIPATLADIPRILTDPAQRRAVVGLVHDDETLAQFWAWFENQSPQAQAAAIAAPLSRLRQLLLRPALLRTLDQRHSPFSLRNIWRDNLIVLVPLNSALIGSGTADMLGSLMVADLWMAVQERAAEANPEKRPGAVYVDEAPRFLHLPSSLSDALAVSRSLGVSWNLAAQFRTQFPAEMRSAIDMNARSKLVFATEYEDAKHFSRGSKDLATEDFTSLKRFEAYGNLVAGGHPQGWSLLRTLPPSAPSSDPEAVRAHSRARWATPEPKPVEQRTAPEAIGSVVSETAVGRKRRQT